MKTDKSIRKPIYKNVAFLACYILFMVLFIAWLFLSNRIVLHFFAPSPNVVGLQQLPPETTEKWHAYMDVDEQLGNLTQDQTLEGFALVEGDDPAAATASVDVVLLSAGASYALSTTKDVRVDLVDPYKDNPRVQRPESSGFTCNFSALGIKNGVYELGYHVRQMNGDEWLVRSGWFYQKDGTGLYYIT